LLLDAMFQHLYDDGVQRIVVDGNSVDTGVLKVERGSVRDNISSGEVNSDKRQKNKEKSKEKKYA
jgi:hypothetical protein